MPRNIIYTYLQICCIELINSMQLIALTVLINAIDSIDTATDLKLWTTSIYDLELVLHLFVGDITANCDIK